MPNQRRTRERNGREYTYVNLGAHVLACTSSICACEFGKPHAFVWTDKVFYGAKWYKNNTLSRGGFALFVQIKCFLLELDTIFER